MELKLESYDAGKHDKREVASLIFESDPVFNSIVYGKNALSVIEKLIAAEEASLYLHVNKEKKSAIAFYRKNGFEPCVEGTMVYKGDRLSQVLMKKTC